MQLEQLAQSILYGDRWEDKLASPESLEDTPGKSPLREAPKFPGRPSVASRIGKAEFPTASQLKNDSSRGRLLHFFANHELLAMELMALMLLKFPEAPTAFRAGIARTLFEEQDHLRLYLGRMRELGVDFGDIPISDYFWNAMKDMASPLQFVIQMSLTLEQANLDFSLFYQRAVAEIGDETTAGILDRVYREEIGHVKHGVAWFNRWRAESGPAGETDWEGYLRLLPPPMTPRRAKGPIYAEEARRLAGLSERFIRELEVYGGSKGRPPVFWSFNPFCELEIARGKPGYSPSQKASRLALDLEVIPTYLARETDVVLVNELPRAEWLREMRGLGFRLPEYRRWGWSGEPPRENKLGGLEPWGWSPESFTRLRDWRERLVALDGANGEWCREWLAAPDFAATRLTDFFSKSWSVRFLRQWLTEHADSTCFGSLNDVGCVYTEWAQARAVLKEALARGRVMLAKAPWGTSGTRNKRFLDARELDSGLGGWARGIIEEQGALVVEPWLEKAADLSLQIEVTEKATRLLGARRFLNGKQLEYRGTLLDPKLSSLPPEALKFLHAGGLARWEELATAVGAELRAVGYQGPAGLDAMLVKGANGLFLKPLVELNPRWTMGRVALGLEEHVAPGAPARWLFLSVEEGRALRGRFPATLKKGRIAQGLIFTNDPETAREVITVLAVGEPVISSLPPVDSFDAFPS